jgi:hypothetical protein
VGAPARRIVAPAASASARTASTSAGKATLWASATPPPAAGVVVVEGAVGGEQLPSPQGDDHAARLEEHHLAVRGLAGPAERIVERAGPVDVGDAERDQ